MSNVLGLDVGGTKIFAGRYGEDLTLEAETKVPTHADQEQAMILQQLLTAIEAVRNEETKAIGLAWAGFVNPETGKILNAPNIPALNGFNVAEFLTEKTGLPCQLENDARCFALGEYLALKPAPKVCLGLILGTGVGSGLIINGQIFHGASGSAGEVGHITINQAEIEAQVAAPALKTQFAVSQLTDLDRLSVTDIDVPLQALVCWLETLLLAYDPDRIVIGGGAGVHFWAHYKSEIIELLNKKVDQYPIKFELHFSERKNAGAEGAAWLAING